MWKGCDLQQVMFVQVKDERGFNESLSRTLYGFCVCLAWDGKSKAMEVECIVSKSGKELWMEL